MDFNPHNSHPVGIFDSGIGGLTVANAVSELLPMESILYYGDTAHLPYGDKSAKAIRSYSQRIVQFLLNQNCKMIVIACNSASASVSRHIQHWVPPNFPIVNVIDPVVEQIANQPQNTVGLIGTKRTVSSRIFHKKLKAKAPRKTMQSMATPLLAPMIEEGFYNNAISKTIIENYLNNRRLYGIQSLVLACTHYPLILKQVQDWAGKQVVIHNNAQIVAQEISRTLTELNLANTVMNPNPHQFFVSDYTAAFEMAAKRFFGKKIKLQEHNLFD